MFCSFQNDECQVVEGLKMFFDESFKGTSGKLHKLGASDSDNITAIDWTSLTNTEKMVKAIVVKAQWASQLNALLD